MPIFVYHVTIPLWLIVAYVADNKFSAMCAAIVAFIHAASLGYELWRTR